MPSTTEDESKEPITLRERRASTSKLAGPGKVKGALRSRPNHPFPLVASISRTLVESTLFTVLTTVLTVYALIGDDFRLLATNKTADPAFDGLTSTCIAIFAFEIILSIIGKEDYFLSFFFLLDIVSTVTLVLDLTPVNDAILGDEEEVNNMRGSRAAKIGARATRVVRVVRLVRILKLYKAIYEAQIARKQAEARKKRLARQQELLANHDTDDDDWVNENTNDEEDAKELVNRESRVGKKLSELTIRRVICLVLAMMLANMLLRIDTSLQYPTSASYAADVVNEAFEVMQEQNTSWTRRNYEKALLQMVYYHNWYTGHSEDCPLGRLCSWIYTSQVFWVGIVGSSWSTVVEKAGQSTISESAVQEWEASLGRESSEDSAYFYNFGSMPSSVQQRLSAPWTLECVSTNGVHIRRGFSFLQEEMESPVKVSYAVPCPEDLRRQEKKKYAARLNIAETRYKEWHFAFYFDLRPFVREDAIYNLLITIFVCIALCVASLVFSQDADRLVLHPLENMIYKVDKIRDNPLAAMKVADEDFKKEEIKRAKTIAEQNNKYRSVKDVLLCRSQKEEVEIMETVVLEKTIIKLGSLLALGFGEAGASIIEHNMHGVDSASVDAMVQGLRVECIIGAIRIRDFSTATEVLQSKVMTFVNQIAEIVHGVVDEFHGYASKNNGDLFLMIWRTADLEESLVSKLGDMSLVAFTRILTAVQKSPVLATYRGHPGLLQRLGKNARVNLSTGLHFGWAIEGAVGSEFKVDAAYLSPNVSLAESVERATNHYGVYILMSEALVKLCTHAVASKCRLIDTVIIAGSSHPMKMYTMDLDLNVLTVEEKTTTHVNWTTRQRFRVRQFMDQEKSRKLRDEVRMVTCFSEPDIMFMRAKYTMEFLHVFNMGYQNYSQGEWLVAKRLLMRTNSMLGVTDGPSSALLKFMEKYNFEAPPKWAGVRELSNAQMQTEQK